MAKDDKTIYDNEGRVCRKCENYKPYSSFHKHKLCPNGYNTICKTCRKPISKQLWDDTSIEYKIFHRARSRANKKNIDFNIELEDIIVPSICPVLNIENFIPSIDKINHNFGYIKGNVRVISNRANMLKNNASIEELELIIADLKRNL